MPRFTRFNKLSSSPWTPFITAATSSIITYWATNATNGLTERGLEIREKEHKLKEFELGIKVLLAQMEMDKERMRREAQAVEK